MAHMILVSPVGLLDPTGKQQQSLIAVASIRSIDPVWTTTAQTQTSVATEAQTGSKITLVNGGTVMVLETMAALEAAAG